MESTVDRRRFLGMSAGGLAALGSWSAPGWTQPATRLATVFTGFPAGDMMDAIARLYAEGMAGKYVETMIVENRPGAGGRMGVMALKQSAPDGRALLFTPSAMVVLYPHVFKSLSYDPLNDLQPVSRVASGCIALTVGPMVPESVTTLDQYLQWCRDNPQLANYATSGAGTAIHLTGANLARLSDTPQVMVAYKGGSPAAMDMLGGQVAALISSLATVMEPARAGRCRILAVTSPERWLSLPDVPTFAESGYPELTVVNWFGVFLPAGTPADIVEQANAAIREAAHNPKLKQALESIAVKVDTSSVEEFAQEVRNDHAHWAEVVKAVGFDPMA